MVWTEKPLSESVSSNPAVQKVICTRKHFPAGFCPSDFSIHARDYSFSSFLFSFSGQLRVVSCSKWDVGWQRRQGGDGKLANWMIFFWETGFEISLLNICLWFTQQLRGDGSDRLMHRTTSRTIINYTLLLRILIEPIREIITTWQIFSCRFGQEKWKSWRRRNTHLRN